VIVVVRPNIGNGSMDEDFLACSYSDASQRHAILADNGQTGILYLHAPSDDPEKPREVEATCFAYNRIEPIETKDVQRYRPNPPPIAKGYASNAAVCREPNTYAWHLIWSLGGDAVLLTRDGTAWAIASADNRRGCSKAIQSPGPWGSPWSGELYEGIKWKGRTKLG